MTIKLPPMPEAIAKLPRDERGYPVPYFVAWPNGKPDHRIADPEKLHKCLHENRCWVCGEQFINNILAFVIGPMCAVNRNTAEPPNHLECARFSVQACPFLTKPKAIRRDANKPDNVYDPPGGFIERNPGVSLIYVCNRYRTYKHGRGFLIALPEPQQWEWWSEGRRATRAEVLESITTGLPALEKLCQDDEDLRTLAEYKQRAMVMLPAA